MDKPTITEVRNHPKLGKGSCSSIHECYTDEELADWIDCLYNDGIDPIPWMVRFEASARAVGE